MEALELGGDDAVIPSCWDVRDSDHISVEGSIADKIKQTMEWKGAGP